MSFNKGGRLYQLKDCVILRKVEDCVILERWKIVSSKKGRKLCHLRKVEDCTH